MKIPFCNSNNQIVCYNKIVHAQLPYEGSRGSIVLNHKEPIIKYFQSYEQKGYLQNSSKGYPAHNLVQLNKNHTSKFNETYYDNNFFVLVFIIALITQTKIWC